MQNKSEKSLQRGLDWLRAQQAADGGWHSQTYGQLKDGAAVTALALYALAHAPEDVRSRHAQAIDRGFAFLGRGLAKRGTIAGPDGSLDFPTYASALWLSACHRLSRNENEQVVVDYLLAAQVVEPRGFEKDSPSYGGWDFLGASDAQGITTGTNISVTRYVLEALTEDRGRRTEDRGREAEFERAIDRGRAYVLRCQQPDGGFAFTCEPASLSNKAAYADAKLTQPRSYGTATCDGARGLAACGLEATDEPLAKALAWLGKRRELDVVPGFAGLAPETGWHRGLRFYYYASLRGVLPLLAASDREAREAALRQHVGSLQKDDGRWVNESDRMRENDPLIATPLAIMAVA